MTILTKPFGDKKPEKKLLALSENGRSDDPEHGDDIVLVAKPVRYLRLSTIILFISAVTVLCLGIMTGLSIYRAYGRPRIHRFHGFCGVPYDSQAIDNADMAYMNQRFRESAMKIPDGLEQFFFKEEIEMDLSDEDSYTKITVPDFRDGRSGRFLHDFNYNQSMIMDKDNNRCFVMSLDRERILPPQSLFDVLNKMYNGYYNIDTEVVRKNMRVVLPPVKDLSEIAPRIAAECVEMQIFMLEKFVGGVFKRSADLPQTAKYAEFGGKNIVEFNFINMNEVLEYESDHLIK